MSSQINPLPQARVWVIVVVVLAGVLLRRYERVHCLASQWIEECFFKSNLSWSPRPSSAQYRGAEPPKCCHKATQCLNRDPSTLIGAESSFDDAAPFLFGSSFQQKMKDHVEARGGSRGKHRGHVALPPPSSTSIISSPKSKYSNRAVTYLNKTVTYIPIQNFLLCLHFKYLLNFISNSTLK